MNFTLESCLPTGNDIVTLPSTSGALGGGTDVGVLSKKYRGTVEFRGAGGEPFMRPVIHVGGKRVRLEEEKGLIITKEEYWTPCFSLSDAKNFELTLRVLAPVGERGFLLDYSFRNLSAKRLQVFLGAEGRWENMVSLGPQAFPLGLARRGARVEKEGRPGLALGASSSRPEFAVHIAGGDDLDVLELSTGGPIKGLPKPGPGEPGEIVAENGKPLYYLAGKKAEIEAGGELNLSVIYGLGLDAVSAAAAAAEMARQGAQALRERHARFLAHCQRRTGDAGLDSRLNENLIFNYFFAAGLPLDSEELAGLTSRSSRFEEGCQRRDRDAFFWSFPSILLVDFKRARLMLESSFLGNSPFSGVQSRYLDGSVLDPAFALDALCAPVIALAAYTRASGDPSLAGDFQVRKALRQVEKALQSRKHPQINLYETVKGPSGDTEPLPYLTYANVMVWRAFLDMAEVKERGGRDQEGKALKEQAEKVRAAIWQSLIAEGPKGKMFAWAGDLKGNRRFETQPAGCLQLLPYWGFCEDQDPVFRNTAAFLHSREFEYSFEGEAFEEIGCSRSPHPWLLSVCNSLLSGRRDQARALLEKLPLDDGLACRSFSAQDGRPQGGQGFAAAAGFLAWSMWKAFGKG